MSIEAISWALRDAPVEDPTQALILCAMADRAKKDGTEARASQATWAHAARCSERTLRRHLKVMEAAGVIRRGDQSLVAHIRVDRRPVVWDLAMELKRTGGQIDPPSEEPSSAAGQSDRADTGDRPDNLTGRTQVTPRKAKRGVNHDRSGGTRLADNTSFEPSLTEEPSLNNPEVVDAEIVDDDTIPLDLPAASASGGSRADVEQVCRYLSDAIVANGSRRPTITKKWRDEARLMIDKDGRTVAMIIGAIDWSQASNFWQPHITSMSKLREKYDTMRLQAQNQSRPQEATSDRKVRETMALVERLRAEGR